MRIGSKGVEKVLVKEGVTSRRHRVRSLLLAILAPAATWSCVIKPVDQLEIPSRTSSIPYEIVFPESSGVPYVYVLHLDQKDQVVFSELGGLTNVAYYGTDDVGVRWSHATKWLYATNQGWYTNGDWYHPNAKWKKHFRFQWQTITNGVGGKVAPAYTFKGMPNGDFDQVVWDCWNYLRDKGGAVMGPNCSQGDMISIYALGD
jgi:hypothetical protein